jgi:hypothetical protein
MNRWIKSAPFDLGLIIGPAFLAVALVLAFPALRAPKVPPWAFLIFVVFIDVAHVWSSLYRTYFDRDELRRRLTYYIVTPLLCFLIGAVLYYTGGYLLFWRVLAYLAVFHFVRQQMGFVMVYRHRAGERDHAWIDKLAVYATMLYPLAYWHATPNRAYDWFVTGDFIPAPSELKWAGLVLYTGAITLFVGRQVQLLAQRRPINGPKIGIVAATALTWYVGIVAFNSDFAFTVTNVVAHGVPYIALIWLYGRRRWSGTRSWLAWLHHPAAVVGFVGLLLALGYAEEGLWDLFIWREHLGLFGARMLQVPDEALAVIVPALVLPQATHYVLDAWIWKFDGSNPGLRYYLFLEGEKPVHAA